MVLWFACVYAFSVGVFPLIWGNPVKSQLMYFIGFFAMAFVLMNGIKEAERIDSFTFYRRAAMAAVPFLVRQIA